MGDNMGFRYRKSINLGGGFRINLSKKGVGYSWGIPGYRLTKSANGRLRQTMSIPGTGLSYVDELKSGKKRQGNNNYSHKPVNENDEMLEIGSADINEFQSAQYKDLILEIEKRIKLNYISNILLGCILLIGIPPLVILPIIGGILKILIRTKLRVNLEYTFEDDTKHIYDKKVAIWLILNKSINKWQITHESEITNKKINAGAGRNIKRILLKIKRETPPYLKTNISPVVLALMKEKLIILPDKILIIRGSKIGAIGYENLNISTTQTRFIENGPVAKDAEIIDYTWQYVNKNGSPDMRYKNNKRLPVCLYGVIKIISPEGLNIEIQTSSIEVLQELKNSLKQLSILEKNERASGNYIKASVTQRIKQIKQPRGGYINPKEFSAVDLSDDTDLYSDENIHSALVGLAVDYMTRYTMGAPIDKAFRISLLGASLIKEDKYAEKLLKGISGLDDKSISNACKLVGYDVCFRAGVIGYKPVQDIEPDSNTISNIRIMVNRSINFINEYGPITKDGFTFEGGYTDIVSKGDGDFLTETTLWDFKVSNKAPTNKHTLQLLMYYLLGIHSIHEEFETIKNLGIFNPRLNKIYLIETSKISHDIIEKVSSEVIGY